MEFQLAASFNVTRHWKKAERLRTGRRYRAELGLTTNSTTGNHYRPACFQQKQQKTATETFDGRRDIPQTSITGVSAAFEDSGKGN
jgi:hypothetical protein